MVTDLQIQDEYLQKKKRDAALALAESSGVARGARGKLPTETAGVSALALLLTPGLLIRPGAPFHMHSHTADISGGTKSGHPSHCPTASAARNVTGQIFGCTMAAGQRQPAALLRWQLLVEWCLEHPRPAPSVYAYTSHVLSWVLLLPTPAVCPCAAEAKRCASICLCTVLRWSVDALNWQREAACQAQPVHPVQPRSTG